MSLPSRSLSLPGDALYCTRQGYPLNRHNLVRTLHQLGRPAGISGVRMSPHTQFVRNGGDPFSLQRLLGHSDIQTVMVYVHMAGTALREAAAKASPGVNCGKPPICVSGRSL